MKRFSLSLIVVALSTMFAYAGGIKVVQGKASFMKNEGNMTVVFNWKEAKWNNEEPVKEHWGDEYQAYVENGESCFIDAFNKSSKKVRIVKEGESSDYVMTVNFSNFDKFFSAMSIVPGNKHKIWAEIIVTDKNSGEVICKYAVKEFKGGRDFSVFDSFKESMADLASELAGTK